MWARGGRAGPDTRRSESWIRTHGVAVLLGVLVLLLAAGGLVRAAGEPELARAAWFSGTGVGLLAGAYWSVAAARRRRLAADVLAVLALAGAWVVGEALAGAVIAVMLGTGRGLEAWAAGRSERQLRALLDRAPRIAHRMTPDGQVLDVEVEAVGPGERLLVRTGEVFPVDAELVSPEAVVDEAALTGESLPVQRQAGAVLHSGTVNAGPAITARATATAGNSTYAAIVALVSAAKAQVAPATRLADRFAGLFLIVSLVLAGGAAWLAHDLARGVAVLVVATPCPLILAVPVAMISGLSRAAQRGVVIKGSAVLERLAQGQVLILDKTGTLTVGVPVVVDVMVRGPVAGDATRETIGADEVLRLAASVDATSNHVLAAAIVRAARARDLVLAPAQAAEEIAGTGVRATVDGRAVTVGKAVPAAAPTAADEAWREEVRRRAGRDGAATVFVGVDGTDAGAVLLADAVRPDAARTLRRLRTLGLHRIVMATGDRREVADRIGLVAGVDRIVAECSPAEKSVIVTGERDGGVTVMVGDGINDAPALALADVGIAIGARGATVASEAAGVVLVHDRLDRLADAVLIAQRARTVALQSVVLGIGASAAAMVVASVGLLPPVWGAVLQEVIDLAAVGNALRVLRTGTAMPHAPAELVPVFERFAGEHVGLAADLDQLLEAADALGTLPRAQALGRVQAVYDLLRTRVAPHEQAEDRDLYPAVARVLGGTDPTATMSRAHAEIGRMIDRIGVLVQDGAPLGPGDIGELRGLLYGLHAVLALHNAQEDESYLSLLDPGA